MARGRRVFAFGVFLVLGVVSAVTPAAAGARRHPVLTPTVSANHPSGASAVESEASPHWLSGTFAGFSAVADKDFGVWRGRPITSATDFQTNASWQAFDSTERVIKDWRGQNAGIRLSIAVPLWAGYGDHLAAAASGYYDQHFVTMARRLVAAGLGDSVLRIGWEFNGGWFRWGITAHGKPYQYATRAREFASAWRHIVTAIRSVKGGHFGFDWCVSAGPHYRHLDLAYPGNSYVDYIGMDVYDWNRAGVANTPSARWHAILHQGTGLSWLAKFAAAHGKQVSIPEWALVHDSVQRKHSGGDDKSFVRHMHRWFATHNLGYENYFNASDGWMSFQMNGSSNQFPVAGKVYRSLWARVGGVSRLH
ncbi:MAG TPA: glycosyl hydrolase [Mycobacteriales bacterium]|nr:glycosyl hydrolase [Mycobacteriales bacterium]HWC34203.1 glycosyl hydrolase [Mycobacteriales bacterium]